ncbi:hypothetical protein Ancab_016820 [Ancistrocladus abbreviatus]
MTVKVMIITNGKASLWLIYIKFLLFIIRIRFSCALIYVVQPVLSYSHCLVLWFSAQVLAKPFRFQALQLTNLNCILHMMHISYAENIKFVYNFPVSTLFCWFRAFVDWLCSINILEFVIQNNFMLMC